MPDVDVIDSFLEKPGNVGNLEMTISVRILTIYLCVYKIDSIIVYADFS